MSVLLKLLAPLVVLSTACESNLKISTAGSVSQKGLTGSILTYDKATSVAPKNSSHVPIGGQCTDGDIIGVRWSKESHYIQETPCQSGRWTVDIPIADFETHSDGLVADIVNKHGEGVSATLVVDLDLKELRPTVSISESVALLSNAANFTLSGACSAWGQNVEISGSLTFGAMCENGQWQKIVDLSEQADGTLTFIANHKNAAGWPAVASIRNILKDTVPPTVSLHSLPVINIANANSYTISGLCSENGETVNITGFANAQAPCANGSFSVNVNTSSVSDGAMATITAMISDKAGNPSTLANASTTKDVTAPTITINASPTINTGNQGNFTLSGLCSEDGQSVSLSGDVNLTANCNSGAWTLNVDFTSFNDGNIPVHATQSDIAGNTSAQASRILLKSTGLPVVTIDPMTINVANEANGPVTGTCSVTGQNVVIGGDVAATVLCVGGIYSANINFSSLLNGNINVTADHSDGDGNNATQATQTFVKDSAPPSFTSLAGANEASNGYINASEVASNQALFVLNASGYTGASFTIIQSDSPSITCDDAQTYGQATIPTIDMIPMSDASYVVCVRLSDASGNITYGKSQVIVRDTTAPTVNVGLDVIARSSFNVDAASTDATTFAWSETSGPGTITFSDGSAEDTSVSASADGNYVLRLTVQDVAGNSAFDELNFDWDTTAPTFTSLVAINQATDGYVNVSEVTSPSAMYQLSATDYTTVSYTLPLDNSIAVSCDASKLYDQSSIPVINSLPASDRPYVVCVQLEDIAGNIAYGKSAVVIRDVLPPTVNVGGDVTINSPYSINATTTDGSTYSWSTVSGPGTITFGSTSVEDTTASASTDGTYVIRLTVTDVAGNSAFDELTMVWNATGPAFSSLASANEAANGYINAAEISSTNDFATLTASNYTIAEFTSILPNDPAITCDAAKSYVLSSIPAINTIPAADGDYAMCVRLKDAANNIVYGKSTNVVRDTTAPAFTSLLGANQALDGFINASETSSASAIADLVASGYASAEFSAILDNTPSITCDIGKAYPNSSIPAINSTPATDDSYALCAKLTDAAGNITYGKSSNIVRDTTVPTVNVGLDVLASASFNINASSTGAVTFAWSKSSGPGSITFGDANLEDTSVVAGADGSYVLRLTVQDAAGNSAFDELNFEWDTTSPTFTSLVAINQASDGYVNASEASSASDMYQLTANGYSTIHYTLPLDNSIVFTCDVSETYGQSTMPAINTLPASDKPYAICVKLEDAAGNITYGKSAIVTRDVTPPTVNVGSDVTVNSSYSINATTADGASYSWSQTSGAGTVTFGSPSAEDTTATANVDGVYVLRLTVTDSAGNSAHDELAMTWNTTGPSFTSLAGANQASDGYINSSETGSSSAMFVLNAANYNTAEYSAILDESTPQVCDGSQSYSAIPIPLINNLPGTDKPYVICVRLTDGASNVAYGKSQTIVRDTLPPTVNVGLDVVKNGIHSIDASSTDGATFSWTKQSGSGTVTFGTPNAEDTSVSASADDTYVLRLTVFDAAGNSAFDELNFIRDTQAPTFTSLLGANEASNGFINASETSSVSAIVSLAASNYTTANYTAILDNTPSITCDAGKSYSNPSIPVISSMTAADDNYAVCVKLVDAAGNTTYGKSQSIVRDTLPPSINVGGDFNTNGAISINATTVDATTFTWTQQSGPGIVTFGNPNSEDSGAGADMDGTYVLRLTVADAAGNSAFDELTYIKDTVAPTFTSLVGANEASDNSISASEVSSTSAIVSLSASDYTTAEYSAILGNTPSITCNAAKTYVGTSVPAINTIPAADDDYAVCVKLSDAAGNVTYGKSSVITRDVTPPTFTSLLGANQASNGYINASEVGSTSAVVTLSASNYTVVDYTAILDNTPSIVCDASKTYLGSTIPAINTMTAIDDTYAVCVRLRDVAGNTTYGKSQSIVRLTTFPTVSVGSDITSNNSISIDATTSGAASFTWTKQSGSGTITFGTPNAEDSSVLAGSEDTYVIRLTVTDVAGNTALDEMTYVFDTTPPIFTSLVGANEAADGYINNSEKSSTNPSVALTASNYATAEYSAILDNTPSITCDVSKTYFGSIPTISSMPASDDSYAVCVRLTDTAGNVTYGKSTTIIRDIVAPTFTLLAGANEANNGYLNASEAASSNSIVTLSASNYTTATYTAILDETPAITCDGNRTYSNGAPPLINSITFADDSYVVCVRLVDAAGNITYGKSDVIVLDRTAPTFTSLLAANQANDGYINASETAATGAIATLAASDYTLVRYTAILDDNPSIACDVAKTYGNTSIPAINTMPTTDDSYAVCVRLTDAAGNNTYGKSQTIVRDATPPTVNVGADLTKGSLFTINATTSGATVFAWTRTSGSGTVTFGTSSAEDTTVTVSVAGTHVLRLTATDAAGNSAYDEMTLTWDMTPPTFTSLVAVNEASDSYINASETSSTNAIVSLTASDYTLAEYSAILDNTPSITCDGAKSYLSTSIPQINTMPATDDTYAVCVKLSDAAGNVTYGKSVSIVRDATPPTFTSLSLANQAADGTINNADIALNNAIVSTVSGSNYTLVNYVVALSSANCTTEFYGSSSLPLAGSLVAGLRKVCVLLGDAAGNYTYGNSANFTVDTTVPTVDVGSDVGRNTLATITPSVSGATTYQWSVSSGTAANITFGTPTAANTTVSASVLGEYTLRLTASTASGNSAYDELYFYWLPTTGDHTLFVTSTAYTGNLGGLSGADAKCNARAAAGGLAGTYKALLSTTGLNAKSRVTITGAVRLKNGSLLATNSADFWDGTLAADPSMTETGSTLGSDGRPWTGSTNTGVLVSGKTCNDWTYDTNSVLSGNQGYVDDKSSMWFGDFYEYFCNTSSQLYCLQDTFTKTIFTAATSNFGSAVDLTFNLPPSVTGYNTIEVRRSAGATAPTCGAGTLVHTWTSPFTANTTITHTDSASASTVYSYTACVKNVSSTVIRVYKAENVTSSAAKHLMFHTSTQYAAGALGGIAGADAKCQTHANNAGLPGSYLAMLSTSSTNIKDRLTISAPVYNRAGVLVANNAADLWDGSIADANLYTEAGNLNNYYAATGSTSAGLKVTGYMCSDWTSTSGQVAYGITQSTSTSWLNQGTNWNCADATLHLYCISQ